jgi:siroheme synthase (precorrin-2 oxidase/ferrochelatase)
LTVIKIELDDALKKRMEEYKDLNWNKIISQTIRRRILDEMENNLEKAILINKLVRKKAPDNVNTPHKIRRFREGRMK